MTSGMSLVSDQQLEPVRQRLHIGSGNCRSVHSVGLAAHRHAKRCEKHPTVNPSTCVVTLYRVPREGRATCHG